MIGKIQIDIFTQAKYFSDYKITGNLKDTEMSVQSAMI